MPRTLAAVAGAALTLMFTPTAFAAQGFSYGVAAGDITPRSAILWGKADEAGTYGLEVADKRGFRRGGVAAFVLKADEADDFTLQRRVEGLKPGSRYVYRFTARKGRRSDSGTFVTAPVQGPTPRSSSPGPAHRLLARAGRDDTFLELGPDLPAHAG
jgi:phosphodiesterase/alkaline phosphatase D-like protein